MVIPNGTVPPTYFDTLRIPVRAGRNFAPDEAQGNVIVSEGLAQRFWPEGGAVGRRFRMSSQSPWLTVVGVVGSVQASGGSYARTTLQFYYPLVPRPQVAAAKPPAAATAPPRRSYSYSILTVRADNPSAAVQHIKEQIWSLDRDQPVERVAVVEDKYAEMFAKERFVLQLMGAFALVALVLTAAGIFGVLSQVVAERRREIGIRMAIGARPADVMRMVLSRGMLLAGIGAAIGIAGALALVKTVQALLYGVKPTDPLSFGMVTALLLGVALAACWIPTRSAMRVHPAEALRVE